MPFASRTAVPHLDWKGVLCMSWIDISAHDGSEALPWFFSREQTYLCVLSKAIERLRNGPGMRTRTSFSSLRAAAHIACMLQGGEKTQEFAVVMDQLIIQSLKYRACL